MIGAVVIAFAAGNVTRLLMVRRSRRSDEEEGFITTTEGRGTESFPYWLLVVALIAFGLVGAIGGYGIPALAAGVTFAVLSGARHAPLIFWPPFVAVMMLVVGYMLLAPVSCTTFERLEPDLTPPQEGSAAPASVSSAKSLAPVTAMRGRFETVTCERILLPDYVGTHEPSPLPPALAVAGIALAAGNIARLVLSRRSKGSPVEKTDPT